MTNTAGVRESYELYRQHMRKLADVRSALALMQWDQETYMPVKGSGFRARQVATLSELAHEMVTSEKLESLLDSLDGATGLDDTGKKKCCTDAGRFSETEKISCRLCQDHE